MLWDRFIRLFHWSTASIFITNYFLLEGGSDTHEWAGYAALALLTARVLWGFIGPMPARFASFFPTRGRLTYAWKNFGRLCKNYRGHNAIGALMVLFLLTTLALTGITGWMQELDYFWGEDWLQTLHETLATTVLCAVVIHVSAVLTIQIRYRTPLIQGMTHGHPRKASK